MSISFEQYYRGIVPVSIDRSNFSVKLNYNATLTTTSGQLGINLGNANTWTAEQTFEPQLLFYGTSSAFGRLNDYTVFGANNSAPITTYHDNTGADGIFISSFYSQGVIGKINTSSSTYNGLTANSHVFNLVLGDGGQVWTSGTVLANGNGDNAVNRNTLDDGSGNMSIAGNLSVTGTGGIFATANTWSALQTFSDYLVVGLSQTSQSTGKLQILSSNNGYGQLQIGNAGVNDEASMSFSNGVTAFNTGEPTTASGGVVWDIGLSNWGSGTYFGIGNNVQVGRVWTIETNGSLAGLRNTLDDGSGNMSVAGNLSVTGTGGIFATTNTWTAEQTFNDILTVGGSSGLDSANIGLYPYATSGIVLGEYMSFISIWGNGDPVGGWIGENYGSIQMGIYNRTTTTQGALAGSKWMMNLGFNQNGAVYTFVPTNYDIGVSASENASVRNTLDDGSGNITVNGQYLNLNYGGNGGAVLFGGTTVQNGNSKAGGASFSGRPRIGDWGEWLTIGEPNGTYNGSIIQIDGGDQYVGIGTSSGITDAPTIHTKFATNTGGLTYYQGLSGAGWGLSQIIDVASATGYTGTGGATLLSVSYGSNFALRASAFYYLNSFASGATMPNITFGTTDWTGNGYTATVITGNNVGDDTFATASAVLACKSGDSVVIAIGTGSGTYNLDYFVMLERVY